MLKLNNKRIEQEKAIKISFHLHVEKCQNCINKLKEIEKCALK